MLDFYPMDGEHQIGFVEVPIEFEQWLIAVSGISFEDVALNILGEDDGQVELIMDYDDYMNLCDLYFEYDTLGWAILHDPDYVEEVNAIPDYEAEDFIGWNYTAEGSNCFICGRLWRPGDYEGHDNICITCADIWQYDEGGPEGEGYYRHAETFDAHGSGEKMDDDYTDEQLLKVARWDIENQIDNGTMYAIGEEPEPFDDGENFYTIVTLYAQYHKDEDKAEKILWEMFREEYPQYLGTESETFEAPYAGLGSLFKFGDNQSALGGFTAKELTESSAIHGDFDSASLNYSGKQNLEVRQAEDKCKCNRGDWKDEPCWECTDCGEHHTTDRTSHAAETFDAHARYNINRYAPKNNPRHNISGTRRKIKQQMWEDTTATVGVKGAAAIIAAVVVGIIAWKKK